MTARTPLDRLGGRIGYTLSFLRRVDFGNVRMLTNALSILGRASLSDWYYNRELLRAEIPGIARNFVLDPEGMNEFQRHAPVAGYTSTPEDGLLAGFSELGRLSALFYPHTGFTQQIPYYETGGGHLDGAKPREGGFFGARVDGEVRWLWEPDVEHDMRASPGTNLLDLTYEDEGMAVAETAYVLPEAEALFRDVTVENGGDREIESIVYYTQANVNANCQYPPGITSTNRVRARERGIEWEDEGSDLSLRLLPAGDYPVRDAGVADAPLDRLFAEAARAIRADHVGGYVEFDLPVLPGETETLSVVTTGRDDLEPGAGLLATTPGERQATVESWWEEYLDPVDTTEVPGRFVDQYVRSVVGMAMLCDPASGSVSAAPNFQPAYYPSWPRDGSFVAVALARAGVVEPAKRYLAEFLPRVQEEDGGFEQCYASNGEPAGIIHRENDQQPIYVHAVRAVYDETDEAFLKAAWPAVEAALAYTIDAVTDNGLLAATHDYAEMWSHARQSLWTNAFAYRAFLDGAYLAEERGEDGERYREAAARMGDAIEATFLGEEFVTELTILGPECDPNPAFSTAITPTGWAGDYGHADDLLDFFERFHHEAEGHWLPREFIYAAACYAGGDREEGDRVLLALEDETLPGGTFAEEVAPDGDHRFAALGWSNAGFVSALHERARSVGADRPVGVSGERGS